MAGRKGITQQDVWQAADALLLEGERPTVEKIRNRVGHGSPNTIGPLLDGWFKSLGGRIKDPLAFRAPPVVPDPVTQAATQFWEIALEAARAVCAAEVAAEQALLSKTRAELEQQRESLHQEKLRQEAIVQAQNQLLESLQDQLATALRAADENKAMFAEQLRQAQQRLAAREAESAKLSAQLEQARQAQVALHNELAEIKAGCEKDLAAAMLRYDRAELDVRKTQAQLDAALARIKVLEQSLSTQQQQQQALQAELSQARAECADAQHESAQLRMQYARAQQDCTTLRESLQAEHMHNQQLLELLTAARQPSTMARGALKRVQLLKQRKRF